MRAFPLLTAGLAVAAVVGLSVAGTEDQPPRQPVSVVVEDEGPGTERVQDEPRYACVDGVCDTWGESDEGPGTAG